MNLTSSAMAGIKGELGPDYDLVHNFRTKGQRFMGSGKEIYQGFTTGTRNSGYHVTFLQAKFRNSSGLGQMNAGIYEAAPGDCGRGCTKPGTLLHALARPSDTNTGGTKRFVPESGDYIVLESGKEYYFGLTSTKKFSPKMTRDLSEYAKHGWTIASTHRSSIPGPGEKTRPMNPVMVMGAYGY